MTSKQNEPESMAEGGGPPREPVLPQSIFSASYDTAATAKRATRKKAAQASKGLQLETLDDWIWRVSRR